MRRVVVAEAAFIMAAVLGTVPAVGGYSTKSQHVTCRTPSGCAPGNHSEGIGFTTVGIVTQVEGASFGVAAGKSTAEGLAVGKGILVGDKVWVEPKALLRLTDTEGGRVTVAGPAALEFTRKSKGQLVFHIYRGSVKFKSTEGQTIYFENTFASGSVAGESVVWTGAGSTQVLGLAGDVKVWHPQLTDAVALVTPGYFTESTGRFKHLNPTKPARADDARVNEFLARFERSEEDHVELKAEKRALASAPESEQPGKITPKERGSRTPGDVVENKVQAVMSMANMRLRGQDIPEDDDDAPLATAGPKRDAYGQPLRDRSPASVAAANRPAFEIVKQGKHLDAESKLFVNKLTGKKPSREQ